MRLCRRACLLRIRQPTTSPPHRREGETIRNSTTTRKSGEQTSAEGKAAER
jgi:hypothetical protein